MTGIPRETVKNPLLGRLGWALFVLATLYLGTAITVYAFKNPTLTQTQLFLHIPRALSFQGRCDLCPKTPLTTP